MTFQSGKHRMKMQSWDYDYLVSKSDDECCYSLSEREVQIILAMIDPIAWRTRYVLNILPFDQSTVDKWQGNLARKLMSGCCPDEEKLTRFTDTGEWEVSTDGGETWHSEPGSDPRNDGTSLPPIPGTGDNVKCAAADNARDQFKAIRDQLISLLTAGTTVLAVIAGIMGAIGVILGISAVGTAIGVLLVGLATALLATTPESVEEDLSDEIMDQFRCILFCHMQDNGQFTYEDWQAVITECDSTFTGFAHTFFHGLVAGMGYIGLSNAGTIGATSADDCDDCECGEWCYTFDFSTGEHGWNVRTTEEFGLIGRYTVGVGYQQRVSYDPVDNLTIEYPSFDMTNLTSLTVYYDPILDGPAPRTTLYLNAYGTEFAHLGDGGAIRPFTGIDTAADFIGVDTDPHVGDASFADFALVRITITGTGDNPFGTDNCP